MKISSNLDAEQFIDFVKSINSKHTVEIKTSCGEICEVLNSYSYNCKSAYELDGVKISATGTVKQIQTDCFPLLLTLDSGITFAVDEPLRSEVENKVQVGNKLNILANLKPKYTNGDFFYDLRLTHFDWDRRENLAHFAGHKIESEEF